MLKDHTISLKELFLALIVVFFALSIHGSIPFLMLPTLGQALWTMGFSQSFANGPLFGFHAHDIGIPKPAAIAFGLAGSWPASLLIRLGFYAADAYATMNALWLGLAIFSAYQIARRFEASRSIALLGSLAWVSMPIVWVHASYSMLSLGIALLSFYFLSAIQLFLVESESKKISKSAIGLYFFATIVSVFMDGYTFMMFATGASILLIYSWFTQPEKRAALLKVAAPIHALSFALAYCLFSAYIGKTSFSAQSIDFFRGWGLDLSFLVIPSRGTLWLPDALGLSVERTDEFYFGDASVWRTTFVLPVLVLGLFGWWRSRKQFTIATGILLVTIFGCYMALGPSLKINSTKPESLRLSHPGQQSAMMPSELAVGPTGTSWISEKLPGFNVMRASYRWSALGVFGFWLLMMIWASRANSRDKSLWVLALVVVILFNLPNLQNRWRQRVDFRTGFKQIDQELITALRQNIHANERVAFVPWGNDFIANYLAPAAGFRTFNIGGDKNLLQAQASWPTRLMGLGGELTSLNALVSLDLLIDRVSDVVVIPYFHMLRAAHQWPCDSTFPCPPERRAALQPIVAALRELSHVEVLDSPLFATVRLSPNFSEKDRLAIHHAILTSIKYPIAAKVVVPLLEEGWHLPEPEHVWSRANAKLRLPVPTACEANRCAAVLTFFVLGANSRRPVTVKLSSDEQEWEWSHEVVVRSSDPIEVKVPLVRAKGGRVLSIAVPEAVSPQDLLGIPDSRVLGIALQKIELQNQLSKN